MGKAVSLSIKKSIFGSLTKYKLLINNNKITSLFVGESRQIDISNGDVIQLKGFLYSQTLSNINERTNNIDFETNSVLLYGFYILGFFCIAQALLGYFIDSDLLTIFKQIGSIYGLFFIALCIYKTYNKSIFDVKIS